MKVSGNPFLTSQNLLVAYPEGYKKQRRKEIVSYLLPSSYLWWQKESWRMANWSRAKKNRKDIAFQNIDKIYSSCS